MLEKIISGGQTGADQGALHGARLAGITTGGTAPGGWRTEAGPQPDLLQGYGLIESYSYSYANRTYTNVSNSDGTLVFGGTLSPGSSLTLRDCQSLKKPVHIVLWRASKIEAKTIEDAVCWIRKHNIRVLNVAGNRESKNPGIHEATSRFIVALVEELRKVS